MKILLLLTRYVHAHRHLHYLFPRMIKLWNLSSLKELCALLIMLVLLSLLIPVASCVCSSKPSTYIFISFTRQFQHLLIADAVLRLKSSSKSKAMSIAGVRLKLVGFLVQISDMRTPTKAVIFTLEFRTLCWMIIETTNQVASLLELLLLSFSFFFCFVLFSLRESP